MIIGRTRDCYIFRPAQTFATSRWIPLACLLLVCTDAADGQCSYQLRFRDPGTIYLTNVGDLSTQDVFFEGGRSCPRDRRVLAPLTTWGIANTAVAETQSCGNGRTCTIKATGVGT